MRERILGEKLYEANLHKKRLQSARDKLKTTMPLDINKYNKLDDVFIAIVDQMLFRFSKLQDTLGEKIFPLILELLKEPVKKMSFIDRLNRLEELELLDKEEWMALREDRNEITHEYSYNEDDIVENINFTYQRSEKLIEIFESIKKFANKKFGLKFDD